MYWVNKNNRDARQDNDDVPGKFTFVLFRENWDTKSKKNE